MSHFAHNPVTPDLSSSGVPFQEINAVLHNSRTHETIAECKCFYCPGTSRLEDFDSYSDDLAEIAQRLVRVARPQEDSPQTYAALRVNAPHLLSRLLIVCDAFVSVFRALLRRITLISSQGTS